MLVVVNEFFEGKRVVVIEEFGEMDFLRFEQVRGVHQSLMGCLRDLFIGADVARSDLGFL